jgi:low temperature requirement protein LtrA
VAVVSQAAHHLADHVTARAVAEFAVVFALIWIGWINGTLYLELHGREDGRTRAIVFIQMGVLALLAVFTGEAAGSSGRGFALTYAAFQALLTWWWYAVHREDREEHREFLAPTRHYITASACRRPSCSPVPSSPTARASSCGRAWSAAGSWVCSSSGTRPSA